MKAIDTNILVRFLVRDDEKQAGLVYRRFKSAEAKKEALFVPLLVVLETIWVLESVYNEHRNAILDSLNDLILMPVFQFEKPDVIQRSIASARQTSLGLADILIAHSAMNAGCESVLTFDKKAAKSALFELLKG